MEWAGPLGAGHGDHKEPKARMPLNVSTSADSLPSFIVIKAPERVAAPHTSVALSLPWFLSVIHPNLPNTLLFHGEEET